MKHTNINLLIFSFEGCNVLAHIKKHNHGALFLSLVNLNGSTISVLCYSRIETEIIVI